MRARSPRLRLWRQVAVALCCLLVAAGCASIPRSGPVQAGPAVEGDGDPGLRFQPVSPAQGASPVDIVRGFLLAASGVEDDHAFARAYLAPGATETWRPGSGTTVMATGTVEMAAVQDGRPLEPEAPVDLDDGSVTVTVSAQVAAQIDATGRMTNLPVELRHEQRYVLRPVDGQWRIVELPDGLLIDEAGFGLAFKSYQLYWAAAAGGFLVPETRWFAERRAIATTLATELLRGPSPWLAPAVVTGFPPGTSLSRPAAVPVVDGEAHVDLTRTALAASADDRALMQVQLQATLRPIPSVSSARMTVEDGELVIPGTVPALVRDPGVTGGAVAVSPQGELVHVDDTGVVPVADVPPLEALGVTDPGRGQTSYTFLAEGGSRLMQVVPGTGAQPEVLLTGAELTAPSHDPYGWVWSTSAASTGVVTVVRAGADVVEVQAPWLAGLRITSLRLARDGARLAVATVGPDGAHRLDLASVERLPDGRPVVLTRHPGEYSLIPALTTVLEVEWTGEVSLAVLGRRPEDTTDRVFAVQPVGAPVNVLPDVPDESGVVSLAAGSGERNLLVGTAAGQLWQRAGVQWVPVPHDGALQDPAFPG